MQSHFNLLLDWTCIAEWISFVYFPIMPLSERPISSLENVLQEQGRCFHKKRYEACEATFFPVEAAVICIKGQQSSNNYSVTSANGSEESSQILFTW